MTRRALILDDDEFWRGLIEDILDQLGIKSDPARHRAEARQLVDTTCYDLAIIDILMDEYDRNTASARIETINLLMRIQTMRTTHMQTMESPPLDTKVVLLTNYATRDFVIESFRNLGVSDVFVKSRFDNVEFKAQLKKILDIASESEVKLITGSPEAKVKQPGTSSLFEIEIEKRKRELLTQARNCRKEADDSLIDGRNRRMKAKGNRQPDDEDKEWINERRKDLKERYQTAFSKISGISSFEDTDGIQLWLESQCTDWLGLSEE